MSLFGTSPDDFVRAADRKSRNSLFDDNSDVAVNRSKSSSFSDENVAKSLSERHTSSDKSVSDTIIQKLPKLSNIPGRYVEIFEDISEGNDSTRNEINTNTIKKILVDSKLHADQELSILEKIFHNAQPSALTKHEFYVLLALIGLAQAHKEITLEGLSTRDSLPVPNLLSISRSSTSSSFDEVATQSIGKSTPPKYLNQHEIYGISEAELWANSAENQSNRPIPSEINVAVSKDSDLEAQKSIRSSFNNSSGSTRRLIESPVREQELQSTPNGTWGPGNVSVSNKKGIKQAFGNENIAGDSARDKLPPNVQNQPFGGNGRARSVGPEETIIIALLPEKEGVFLFKHHCYHVISSQRGHKVVRRFSDFVWLLDCLQKRFPFRQLPLLPPKRVGLNGNHLATDKTFIEKRRRGLSRFTNALVRHPVLSQEKLVMDFLTLQTEFSVWRKQAAISIQEEFSGRVLPPDLEDSLPLNLNDIIERTRAGIRRSASLYIALCLLMDRLSKRNEGFASEQLRISRSLQSLSDASEDTYSIAVNDVPLLQKICTTSAKHLSDSQALMVDEAKAWDLSILEELKKQRDSFVSMRDLFDRRDLYDKDNIPYLERRIQKNENKLAEMLKKSGETARLGKSDETAKLAEVGKVTEAISKDKKSIVSQHARGILVKECIFDELKYFQETQYHICTWNKHWACERVKYSELQADNWKHLNEMLERINIG